jgi:hypothetical protein
MQDSCFRWDSALVVETDRQTRLLRQQVDPRRARQAVIVAMASAHAALADAAVAGLSAHMHTADTQAWRRAA